MKYSDIFLLKGVGWSVVVFCGKLHVDRRPHGSHFFIPIVSLHWGLLLVDDEMLLGIAMHVMNPAEIAISSGFF